MNYSVAFVILTFNIITKKGKNFPLLSDPLDLPDRIFKKIYRWRKETASSESRREYIFAAARYIIYVISPFLEVKRHVDSCVYILCTLHFYPHGCYQKGAGQDTNCPMSQSFVRCIDKVTNILINHFSGKVKFSLNEHEKDQEKAVC